MFVLCGDVHPLDRILLSIHSSILCTCLFTFSSVCGRRRRAFNRSGPGALDITAVFALDPVDPGRGGGGGDGEDSTLI